MRMMIFLCEFITIQDEDAEILGHKAQYYSENDGFDVESSNSTFERSLFYMRENIQQN